MIPFESGQNREIRREPLAQTDGQHIGKIELHLRRIEAGRSGPTEEP